jgi:hypothetical protein
MRCDADTLKLRSLFRAGASSHDLVLKFDPDITHATLLGHVTAAGEIALPAVLHMPGMGSLRVFGTGNPAAVLRYDARRNPAKFVTVGFPAATAEHPQIEYHLSGNSWRRLGRSSI